jgi:hypothetical protein
MDDAARAFPSTPNACILNQSGSAAPKTSASYLMYTPCYSTNTYSRHVEELQQQLSVLEAKLRTVLFLAGTSGLG